VAPPFPPFFFNPMEPLGLPFRPLCDFSPCSSVQTHPLSQSYEVKRPTRFPVLLIFSPHWDFFVSLFFPFFLHSNSFWCGFRRIGLFFFPFTLGTSSCFSVLVFSLLLSSPRSHPTLQFGQRRSSALSFCDCFLSLSFLPLFVEFCHHNRPSEVFSFCSFPWSFCPMLRQIRSPDTNGPFEFST